MGVAFGPIGGISLRRAGSSLVTVLTRVGVRLPNRTTPDRGLHDSFRHWVDLARAAEASGFDSIWVADGHLGSVVPGSFGQKTGQRTFETFSLLGALAVETTSALLGSLVAGVATRNPAVLAKQVTALDVISSGRAVLGIGAGQTSTTTAARPTTTTAGQVRTAVGGHPGVASRADGLGLSERFARLEEALQVCRSMFEKQEASFEGVYYRLLDAPNRPRPVRSGGPPILIGGNSSTNLRLAAQFADACNLSGDRSSIRQAIHTLALHCDALGRDMSTMTKTALIGLSTAESQRRVASYLELGIDAVIVDIPPTANSEAVMAAAEVLGEAFVAVGSSR
jgi:alkanesulfonate monooxygenase SsuD/methylene tetrahydromethanopterin reductase-like flavin-dependent oxidoreductase (luciferase family)